MTKVYYQILHLPLEEDGLYPDPSSEMYFRPWVDLKIEAEGISKIIQVPVFFLSPQEEEEYYFSYEC